jgi:hypothetical protein
VEASVWTFSDHAKEILQQVGWYPGRSIEMNRIDDWYRSSIPSVVLDFMKEFGDLRIRSQTGSIIFTIVFGEMDGYEPDAQYIREYLGISLVPIGNTSGGVLLMGPEGGCYETDVSSYLVFRGESGPEAVDNLINKKIIKSILDEKAIRAVVPPTHYA